MAITTNQGLILPDGGDNANVPLTFTDFVTTAGSGMENRLVQRYLSIADRTARNPAPNEGELSYLADLDRYESYTGTVWIPITFAVDHQLFVVGGNWNKPAGTKFLYVEVVGGGGGGGGADATGAGQWSFGDGGGGGEYAAGWFATSAVAGVVAVTVGAGGAGGAGAAGAGGGTSSFGAHITAVGGGGGAYRPVTSTARYSQVTSARTGGTGGVGGTIRIAGYNGGMGIGIDSVATGVRGGDGGGNHMASGALERIQATGDAGRLYGGGGGSTANAASQGAARTGGAGAAGAVIVTSYI